MASSFDLMKRVAANGNYNALLVLLCVGSLASYLAEIQDAQAREKAQEREAITLRMSGRAARGRRHLLVGRSSPKGRPLKDDPVS